MQSKTVEKIAIIALVALATYALLPVGGHKERAGKTSKSMPLVGSYIVSGELHPDINGEYTAGGTHNGAAYFFCPDNGGHYLFYTIFEYWGIGDALDEDDYNAENGPSDSIPESGWIVGLTISDAGITVTPGDPVDPDPEPEGNTMSEHFFSTGVLTAENNAGGDPLTLAVLNNINLSQTFQEKKLYESCLVTSWPIDVAHYDAGMAISAEFVTVSAEVLQLLFGNTQSGSNPKVLTAQLTTVALPSLTLVLTTKDTAGGTVTFTAFDVRCPGLNLPLRRDDYMIPNFSSQLLLSDAAEIPYKWEFPTPA